MTLAGGEKDLKKLKLDGKDVWAELSGAVEPESNRRFYWKTPDMSAVRDGDWKLVVTRGREPKTELFNLRDDFREMRDVGEKHPEKVAGLMELMKDFEKGDGKKR